MTNTYEKKYLTKERSMLIVGLLVLVLGLTSCNGLVGVPLDKFDIQSGGTINTDSNVLPNADFLIKCK